MIPPGVEAHWAELVTGALLGTDRRDPPEAVPVLRDLVADTASTSPSERMLAQVAACTAVRRAGLRPGPPRAPLVPPEPDERPVCPPAAVRRWHHVVAAWPVLEDEWMAELLANGWRAAPELVPAILGRARTDPARWRRALAASGSLGAWLVDLLPELAPTRGSSSSVVTAATEPSVWSDLPVLPMPPELAALVAAQGGRVAAAIGHGIESGRFGASHRAVLVNLVARVAPATLTPIERTLAAIDPMTAGYGIAAALVDLAATRRRMREELAPPTADP